MDEDSQHEKPLASAIFSRHRSPTFSKEEIKALVNIAEKYKTIILNKSTTSAASYAKEAAWIKITKIYNRQGFTHVRTTDGLKMKLDNLKKEARKLSKNLMDIKDSEFDDVTNQMIVMMSDVASNPNIAEESVDSDEENMNGLEPPKDMSNEELCNGEEDLCNGDENLCNGDEDKESDNSLDGGACKRRRLVPRSLNFTPNECKLLLQCVRGEKDVLSRATTYHASKVKNRAWARITNSYNKLSPRKRPMKVLRTKFTNLKKLAKDVRLKDYLEDRTGKNREKLDDKERNFQDIIKVEPIFDDRVSQDTDEMENAHETDQELNNHVTSSLDPLQSVLSTDLGLGSVSNDENKEILKLKTDLLHFKMETAKLKRKLIEDSIQAEQANRDAKAIETSLRLRTARLEAIAAEMKLPPTHPALIYTLAETRAQQYIHQYHAS